MYVILILTCVVNWDAFIVKYNFRNAGQSYLELGYLVSFPDKTLPHLSKSIEVLNALKTMQKEKFPYENADLPVEKYYMTIEKENRISLKHGNQKISFHGICPNILSIKN